MRCARHPKNEAVGQCVKCGAFICEECAEATQEFREEHGTLCVDCVRKMIEQAKTSCVKEIADNKKKIVCSIIFYIIGAVLLIIPISAMIQYGTSVLLYPEMLAMFIGGIIMCGFYTAIASWNKAEEEHMEYEYLHGEQYTITENGIYKENGTFQKIISFLIGALFGVILTPFMLIKYSANIKKYNKLIERAERILKYLENV